MARKFKDQYALYFSAVPPHIIGDGIHDITLKKGRPIRYDLWFGGEPAPNVEWIREGRTLANDDATSLELYCKNSVYTERNTVLSIPKVTNILKYRVSQQVYESFLSFRKVCEQSEIRLQKKKIAP